MDCLLFSADPQSVSLRPADPEKRGCSARRLCKIPPDSSFSAGSDGASHLGELLPIHLRRDSALSP